ncbi:hypothetical protein SPRG_14459 [Saprolegnia parasitica CBS 223.65]|uniref:Uncharacterized protein n=1 Tax=Saprolegnia parasitica (strain CBS 223.65) TaxID=695850 RepID=A0A067BPB3_SAPPC|nr:hypothetical protein SPRG_14459 [Saprolegnia parasitica CBS 223.65]KDO20324.1 hypothetical protein SPRG_14459 [Saprolegnia parasitica CBS 223.65]|eukprot:XP_012208993.1 hypothetical protein SPRG_14459 [Saprolegnia parasitica CBS 223.65]
MACMSCDALRSALMQSKTALAATTSELAALRVHTEQSVPDLGTYRVYIVHARSQVRALQAQLDAERALSDELRRELLTYKTASLAPIEMRPLHDSLLSSVSALETTIASLATFHDHQ